MGRVATVGILLLSLFYLLIGLNAGLRVYGDGLSLYAAMRILDGDVPYRDFWTMYAPGEFYLLAGLFRMVSPSITAARVLSVLVNLSIAAVLYGILRKFVSRALALTGLILAIIWIGYLRYSTYPVFPSLLCAFCAASLLIGYTTREKNSQLILGGVLVGMAALFRHDMGLYTWIAGAGVLFSFTFAHSTGTGRGRRLLQALKPAALFSAGVAAAVLPVLCYLLAKVPPGTLWQDLVVFPATVFPEVRAIPYPPPGWRTGAFYHPIFVLAAAVLFLVSRGRARTPAWEHPRTWALVLFTGFTLLFLNQARIRSDAAHLVPALLSSVVPLCLLADEGVRRWRDPTRSGRPALLLIAVLAVFITTVSVVEPLALRWRLFREYLLPGEMYTFQMDRARGVMVPGASRGYENLVDYIRSAVPEGERIYVGPVRHDRVTICDLMLYFLADRHSATGYHEIHPGLTTSAQVQHRIVEDIERAGVRRIVRVDEFSQGSEIEGAADGAQILDEYIEEHFRPVRMFRGYTVWKRKH